MFDLLWLVPALPFLGFILLALLGKRMGRTLSTWVGVGSVGISALLVLMIAFQFFTSPPSGHAFSQVLWSWVEIVGFNVQIALYLDALSLIFSIVITFVGFLIHLYSSEFMEDDEGFSRFFAYMNLFVGSMLMLVLGDNLLLLYLGWEGVGLCSYLLIGFWYRDPQNGYAARKAFVVTRVGDTAMAVGLFILFTHFGTLNIQSLLQSAGESWVSGSSIAILTAALLLGGALGKSAQLPLQTWLPDAMAGPSPVSALIHAATMVTAGVYLIARTNVIFILAPPVQTAVAIIGTLTLLVAGFSAMTQVDIKRVLAYSTISQIGYMFLALGVGAWSAGVFHFMTHAFFKALLFLAAGVVILAHHHEHNMFKMGGVRKQLPVTYWTFLIGSASLAALPLITAGFFSKDQIIWYAYSSKIGSTWLWAGAYFGAFVTAYYTFRMVFVTFFGEAKMEASHLPRIRMKLALIVLAVLSVIGGYIDLPHTMGHFTLFSDFLESALPKVNVIPELMHRELTFQIITGITCLVGIYLAYLFFLKNPKLITRITQVRLVDTLRRFWFSGWAFDWVYDHLFVFPLVWLSNINKNDFIDKIYSTIAGVNRVFHYLFVLSQTGNIRWYAMGITFGTILTIYIVVFL